MCFSHFFNPFKLFIRMTNCLYICSNWLYLIPYRHALAFGSYFKTIITASPTFALPINRLLHIVFCSSCFILTPNTTFYSPVDRLLMSGEQTVEQLEANLRQIDLHTRALTTQLISAEEFYYSMLLFMNGASRKNPTASREHNR